MFTIRSFCKIKYNCTIGNICYTLHCYLLFYVKIIAKLLNSSFFYVYVNKIKIWCSHSLTRFPNEIFINFPRKRCENWWKFKNKINARIKSVLYTCLTHLTWLYTFYLLRSTWSIIYIGFGAYTAVILQQNLKFIIKTWNNITREEGTFEFSIWKLF